MKYSGRFYMIANVNGVFGLFIWIVFLERVLPTGYRNSSLGILFMKKCSQIIFSPIFSPSHCTSPFKAIWASISPGKLLKRDQNHSTETQKFFFMPPSQHPVDSHFVFIQQGSSIRVAVQCYSCAQQIEMWASCAVLWGVISQPSWDASCLLCPPPIHY